MTDRINALTVVLNRDIRDDDVEVIVNAIQMIRGVADVKLNVADVQDYEARARVRSDIEMKLMKAVRLVCRDGDLPDYLDFEKHTLK